MRESIGAVVVAYYPNARDFLQVLDSATNEVDFVVIVNNSDQSLLELCGDIHNPKIEVIENNHNLGIAVALNKGINRLKEKGCSYFLLLDQDSNVPKSMVVALIEAMHELATQTKLVAAIGPSYFNSRLGKDAPFIQFGKISIKKIDPDPSIKYISLDFLITSGTLISLSALNDIGMMDDGLFIDYVDTEWCLRAIAKGYKIYGLSTVRMEHSLGDEPVMFFNKKMPMHSPLRHYYISRNALHLMRRKYIPVNRRVIILISMFKTFIFYSLVPSNRWAHFTMMCKGFRDGVLGSYGRYNH